MTASDAFVSDSTHSYNGNCYFVHVDPNLANLIRDAATVVARVTATDNQGDEAWVDSLVQRAQDALPASTPTPAEDDDEAATPRKAEQDTPELRATKRDLVQQLVDRLKGAKLQNLADRDCVAFVNSFLSLLLETQPDSAHDGIDVLVAAIACQDPKPATTQPAMSTRYSTLATIFNALPSTRATLRLQVLRTLVKYAAENDDVAIVKPALDPLQLEQYFADVADDGNEADETAASLVQSLLNNVGNGAKAATDPIETVTLAREILVARLSSPASSSSSPVRSKLAATLVALLLASNDVYDFTPYARVPAAVSEATSSTSLLVETFKKFTTDAASSDPAAAAEFAPQDELDKAVASSTLFPSSSSSSSPSSSSESAPSSASATTPSSSSPRTASQLLLLRVDRAHLVKKQNLVRFARLCEDKGVGQSVRYDEISKTLGLSAGGGGQVEEEGQEVETWVIDAIRASLVQGRLSQPTQSFLITRVAPLSFSSSSSSSSTSSSWQVIQERLEGWKGALDRVTATVEKSLAVSSGGAGAGAGARGGRFGAEEIVNHHQQQAVEA